MLSNLIIILYHYQYKYFCYEIKALNLILILLKQFFANYLIFTNKNKKSLVKPFLIL